MLGLKTMTCLLWVVAWYNCLFLHKASTLPAAKVVTVA